MSNEWLIIISALVNIIFVFLCARKGAGWLIGSIVANLILISIMGSKLITVFGTTTNAGNVFYACIFLATYFLMERTGKKERMTVIGVGVFFMIFFVALSQIANHFSGTLDSVESSMAIRKVLSFSPRIIVASIVAYIFAQNINISLYHYIRQKTAGKKLWLRANVANIISQFIDSAIFFSIAFFDVSWPILIQSIMVGWLIKSGTMLIATPFLYIDRYIMKKYD